MDFGDFLLLPQEKKELGFIKFQPSTSISLFYYFVAMSDKIDDKKRRKVAAFNIGFVCIGALLLTSAASFVFLPR